MVVPRTEGLGYIYFALHDTSNLGRHVTNNNRFIPEIDPRDDVHIASFYIYG